MNSAFPIEGLVEGWRFRVVERSNGVFEVSGRDLTGRAVSKTGTDPEELLRECVRYAREIQKGSSPEASHGD